MRSRNALVWDNNSIISSPCIKAPLPVDAIFIFALSINFSDDVYVLNCFCLAAWSLYPGTNVGIFLYIITVAPLCARAINFCRVSSGRYLVLGITIVLYEPPG